MSDARYDVVFSGEIFDDFELSDVKLNFAKLFKQAEDKVEQIFSQNRVTIKANLEKSVAEKYQQALAKAGARVEVMAQEPAPIEGADLSIEPLTADQNNPVAVTPEETESGSRDFSVANVVAAPVKPAGDSNVEPQAAAAVPNDESNTQSEARAPRSLPFKFTGNGAEYFKIWIVNIFLTIITLGIYSAWAKVRNKRYFYSNTQLDGSTFEYLAEPINILKGRIIAVVFFLLYSAAGSLSPILGLVLALLMLIVLPWLVVKSLSFNARNSAYRNLSFGFKGDILGALKAFIGWPLLGVFSLGLLMPLAFYKQQKYMVNGYCYGTTEFDFDASARDYFMIFLATVGILLGGGIVAGLLSAIFQPLSVLVMLVAYLYVFAYFGVRTKNLVYSSTTLAQHGFDCRMQLNSYAALFFTNTLFTVLTLGLFTPWAKVRTAHYLAEHLNFEAADNLDNFIADEQQQVSALGEELGDVFDFDIGL